jgi:hypothetical protein
MADDVLHRVRRDVRNDPISIDGHHHHRGMDPSFDWDDTDATTLPPLSVQ